MDGSTLRIWLIGEEACQAAPVLAGACAGACAGAAEGAAESAAGVAQPSCVVKLCPAGISGLPDDPALPDDSGLSVFPGLSGTLSGMDAGADLLVSADAALLRAAAAAGFAVIGYAAGGSGDEEKDDFFGDFTGIPNIVCSPDALTPLWCRTVWSRTRGLPLEIGRCGRVRLRESTEADFADLYRICRESGSDRYTPTMPADEEEARQQFSAYLREAYPFFGWGLWTVLAEDGAGKEMIAGRCGLTPGVDGPELGFIIGRAFRRQGIAHLACRIALAYAFEELEAPAVWADCHEENQAAVSLLTRLGFVHAGMRGREESLRGQDAGMHDQGGEAEKKPEPGNILRFRLGIDEWEQQS